ncbi:MAG TPA: MFS transporter [Candidatus Limosilactobacillus merdipullorum]|uniref:MFS transporter n=1 Tax=Candidatus Limosilactobacillus merdipullorum TaxID=2838653 RepID=A0A9D1QP09_9LACO|nr:MFS transporter [Candidatus Limosilactobacillus merdipullorum]
MRNQHHLITKLAFLSVSFILTSAYAIQGSLPQLKAALHLSQQQAEYLVTTPSFSVMVFVILSPLLQQWLKLSDKTMIMIGVTTIGVAGPVPLFCNSYQVIIASRLVLGAGIGLYNSQAISIISRWYDGTERAAMIGWHAAAEEIGQAATISLASLLMLVGGWRASFAVYFLAIIVLALFSWQVPANRPVVTNDKAKTPGQVAGSTRISPLVGLLAVLAFVLVVDYVGMENRFSGLAVAINGGHYHGASLFLSLMLVGATLGGLFYGRIYDRLKFNTIYLALGLMAVANFLFGLAGDNFALTVAGLLLIGFPYQLLSPLIFNLLPTLAPANKQSTAASICLIGFNLGAFFSPTIGGWANLLTGHPLSGLGLAAPFPIYGVLLLLIALGIFIIRKSSVRNG